jgi:hypothetical protein
MMGESTDSHFLRLLSYGKLVMLLTLLYFWSRPPDMTSKANNGPKQIWLGWEEVSCSWVHDGGGLGAPMIEGKIVSKEKELFWRK